MWVPPTARQLAFLVREWISPRKLLLNRFAIIVVVLVAFTLGGQIYINDNNGNRIDGRVLDANEDPVANATVVLNMISAQGVPSETRTQTNAEGEYVFNSYTERGRMELEFQIWAVLPDGPSTERSRHHLDFPAQSKHIVLRFNTTID